MGMAYRQSNVSEYKHTLFHAMHPTDVMLREAIADWDQYQAVWKERGHDHDYIPYPYTKEMIAGYFKKYNEYVGLNISIDGPQNLTATANPSLPPLGQVPQWAKDASTNAMVEKAVNS